jgi:SAM-dependent MidA family methyltransferase
MGSSAATPPPAASPEFLAVFRAHADATATLTFARFMELALYHPAVGYYRRDRPRVGYGPGTDFFTASTSGPLFGELLVASCVHLLGPRSPADYTFVEIGAEPDRAILRDVSHPFAGARAIAVGEPIALSGPCIVFSNELFDAQPCTRLVFRDQRWRELGVHLTTDNRLVEVELPADFQSPGSAGYHFDQPLAATALAEQIAAQPWTGLFVAFDYGKTLRELAEETPAGTVRAYSRHTQSNDLLAQPGEQDLTCHICWDWLSDALTRHGFNSPQLQSQESFFIRHAADFIAATSTAEAGRFSQRKLSLLQLLSPAHLGQKFQVLHALRP